MAKVKLARGTQSAYNAITTKDNDTIYVCTDTGNIYLGSQNLFESNAFISASISGTTVTFTTHGVSGTAGSTTLDISAGNFYTKDEVDQAISTAVSSLYKIKGSVATYADLPSTGNTAGDVWNVVAAYGDYPPGTNWVWTGTEWDALGGSIDLSGYYNKTEVDTALSAKADKVSGATSGNFAGLDANGNLTDSGKKAADFKTKQTAKTDPTASGNATSFIDTITQNANGEISATKKTVPNATDSVTGLMTSTDHTKLTGIATGAQVNVLEGVQISGSDLTITSKKVNIVTGTAYNATTNKIATMTDISDAALAWGTF